MPDFDDLKDDSVVEIYQDATVQPYTQTIPTTQAIVKEFSMDKAKNLIIMRDFEQDDISTRTSGAGDAANPNNAIDNDFNTSADMSNVEVEKQQVWDFGSIATRDILIDHQFGSSPTVVSGFYELSDDNISYAPEVLIEARSLITRIQHQITGISFRYIRLSYRRTSGVGTGLVAKVFTLQDSRDGGIAEINMKMEIKDQSNNRWRDWITTFPQLRNVPGGSVQQIIEIGPNVTDDNLVKFDRIIPSGNSILRMTQTYNARMKHTVQLLKVF